MQAVSEVYTYSTARGGFGMGGPVGTVATIVALAAGAILWLLLARSSLVHGGAMERSERVPQLYGYTVCLLAIVVMLVSLSSIVERIFTLADPLGSTSNVGWGGGPSRTFVARRNGPLRGTLALGAWRRGARPGRARSAERGY
jgi:hypothetical protein